MKVRLVFILLFFIFGGCSATYVKRTVGPGVQPHVVEEMIRFEKG